jgi:sortase (surface protein transpeptidase)
MADNVYKEQMQDLRTVSPELVEVPTDKQTAQATALPTNH